PDFLGSEMMDKPEMANIKLLFKRCRGGLAFTGKTKEVIGARIGALEGMNSFELLIDFLSRLEQLKPYEDYQILNADGFSLQADVQDNERINVVFNFVKSHFQRQIPLEEIADVSGMTVPSFCRYFKHITGKTFTNFVNEYRLVHASKLLAEKPISIT